MAVVTVLFVYLGEEPEHDDARSAPALAVVVVVPAAAARPRTLCGIAGSSAVAAGVSATLPTPGPAAAGSVVHRARAVKI